MALLTAATTFEDYGDVKGLNETINNEVNNDSSRIQSVYDFAVSAQDNLQQTVTDYTLYFQELTAEVNAMEAGGGLAVYPEYDLWVMRLAEAVSFKDKAVAKKAFIDSVITAIELLYNPV